MGKAIWMDAFPDQAREHEERAKRLKGNKYLGPGARPKVEKPKVALKKPRKRVNAMSEKRRIENREYMKLRRVFLKGKPLCPIALALWGERLPATEIHHIRGRAGSLLVDTRFWLPVSRKGHDWVEANRPEAVKRGWLAGAGDWNKPEK